MCDEDAELKRLIEPARMAVDPDPERMTAVRARMLGIAESSSAHRPRAPAVRWAAAAALVLVVGYGIGRVTAPGPTDVGALQSALEASLRSSLEPAIRDVLRHELNREWLTALADSQATLKDELSEQFCADLDTTATAVLAASRAATDEVLAEVVRSMLAAQAQDRQAIAAVLGQMEDQRRWDDSVLQTGLASFAVYTEDELLRTRNDMAQLRLCLGPARPAGDKLAPSSGPSANQTIERRPK